MPKESDTKKSSVTLLSSARTASPATEESIPEGKLKMVITYLEMTQLPRYPHQSSRAEHLSIIRSHRPTVSFYRYLYNTVGEQWLWYERRQMPDDDLSEIIHHEKNPIYVLYVNGTPAGYSELDSRIDDEIEIAYFGLIPEFIGRGLGSYFLRWTVEKAWTENPQRVWVHTCNFDSPQAIATYQRGGFVAYRQEQKIIDKPTMKRAEKT